MRVNPSKIHVSGKLIGCGSINSYLLSLAQGWGSKEEGLGLYSCVVSNERTQPGGLTLFPSDSENKSDTTQHRLGSTLHFECNLPADQAKSGGMCVIDIPDLHLRKEDDLTILKECVERYNVPPEHRFSLLTRIRYARAFSSPRTSRVYTKISLLAFIVLVQSNDAGDELVSFFTNEPEYTNELIRLVRSEDASVPGSIRALAMLALGAQLAAYASSHERARILSGSNIISAGGNRMVLLGVLQKAILTLNNPTDPSSPVFVDALLRFFLFHVMSTSSSGGSVRASGLVPPLLPLLQDSDPAHMHLVCLAVKILQKLLEYSTPAVSLFKDLGGVQLLAQRLHIEVERVIGTSDEASASAMVVSDTVKSDEDHIHSQKRLIKALLKALGTATYSPANPARGQNSQDNSNSSLSGSLSLIFRQMDRFGGDIYFSAVSLMSEMIHKDPTCFPALQEQGLPDAFLSSVLAGVVPSSKALISIPNGLGAICLNTRGLESVRESSALRFLIDVFTTRKYLIAMNEGVVLLANAMEELLRHQSSLRSSGVEIIIEILNKLSLMGEEGEKTGPEHSGSSDGVADMETDMEIKAAPEGHDLMGGAGVGSGSDGITDNQFIHLCVFHAMVLVHRTMENSESCRLFVEKGGIEILLKLLLRPSITQSSEGMPIALHSTVVFKGFTQHHSAPLARAFSSSLREHLAKALTEVTLDPTSDNHSTPSLFVVEFLLFLAASKDNRWINALLVEFADAGKDVLENIGRVHREALWQIAHLEDSNVLDVDSESSNMSGSDAQRLDSESDDARLGSLRQYIDPLLRRRGSSWSIESQVSDLINIYRDISRVAGARTDRYLSSLERSSSSSDRSPRLSVTNPSPSGSAAGARTVEENKKLSYSSYHDMLTSLSYHIDHLFMELGKAMLLSSRRENNPVNLSPSVVSVAGTIASIVSEHLNFGGHARPNESEVPVTTKCRYLGKVLYFVDGILLDRPDSCNPIILNCFYSRGVIQLILTTFEATSQLLFTVTNRLPASPMETEDSKGSSEKEDSESMWIYGPLASYGAVLDHLVTSSFILSNSTRQLLEQPIGTGSIQFPQDAEAFVKTLQSKVLKVVLPIWTNPHFAECNLEFVSALTSIMRHVYSGVEVKNMGSGNVGSRLAGPPPDESAIALIVEMGFSRARAEEALRQVGTNSVEIATDWLFSHPEEPEEDDDLARALAISLGNSDSQPKEEGKNEPEIEVEEETIQLPPIDEMLTSCIRLLQMKESLAFPVRDMLVTICSQNDGQYRPKVLTFIIDRVREICAVPSLTGNSEISALFHVLALILHDDTAAREAALKAGLAKIALDLLSGWDVESSVKSETNGIPRWVTSCFLSIDQMLQVEPKLPDITELELGKDDKEKPTGQTSVVIDQSGKEVEAAPETAGLLDTVDQKRLLELCCRCMQNHVPSDTMHVVLQLCATLTKVHPIAVTFLEVGGLHALLSLPIGCLFPGFNAIAASIIRHILEDPHTLQQAMELEIRHCLITAANRNGNPRVTPRNFVQSLSDVISRDPVVFMRAARNVCQIDMVGDRPYIVQLKERDKEKSKEKEKDKYTEKDKADKLSSDQAKQLDSNTKSAKAHRKSPQSFVTVIETLLDLVVTFVPPPLPRAEDQADSGAVASSSASDMDIDTSASAKGKGKAVANPPEESKAALQEATASVAKMSFLLKLLTDVLLTYASSINVLLRRDAELSSRGPIRAGGSGGVFSHIIHQFLSCSPAKPKKDKKSEGDWRYKMATRSSQFLVASAIRSAEARKRIFSEISSMLAEFIDSSNGCKAPDLNMDAYIDLLNEILLARSPTGSSISAEASSTFIDVGLVHVLTRTLEVLDLDNSESSKVVTGIVKALELVTKEHVHLSDVKGERKTSSGPNQTDPSTGADRSQHTEAGDQPETAVVAPSQGDASNFGRAPDSVTDEMEHDYDGEDDFMQDVVAEDRPENNDGISTVEITFNIRHGEEDQMVDDNDDDDVDEDESDRDGNDDDMSGDDDGDDDERDEDDEDEDVDDDEDDDGDHDGLEEEEDMHRMHHPDTDPDDHDMDEEEFDEDMLEEDEDEDEEDEEGVILRLEEGINGINVFDHIEVLGGGAGDTLRVMPLDIFGTRRHGQSGRTTSIYNLLGSRSGADQGGRAEHPLLEEPTALRLLSQHRQSG